MKIYFWTALTVLLAMQLSAQTDIEKRLFLQEDLIFKKIRNQDGFAASYQLMIKQPLDHNDEAAGYFYQRVYLNHRGFDNPNVMATAGYDRPRNRIFELANYLDANQIDVEHRFYGASVPDSLDYQYLNLNQATADLHRINQIIKEIYTGPIITTGISKGGMTTLFYRYFYPDDVAVSVPYVAPINIDFKDERIYSFLDNVGEAVCRQQIEAIQTRLLKNKSDYLPLVKWFAKGQGNSFDRLGVEAAYELAVLEYSFSFWQYGGDCSTLPSSEVDDEELLDHFLSVSGVDFFSDQSINRYAPFYYQMGSEMGYYGYSTDAFDEYITAAGVEPSAVFWPENVSTTTDLSLTRKAQSWMTNELERVVYIYGSIDTWTATGIQPNEELDAVLINMEGKNHRSARIEQMTPEELELLESTLERWLNMDIKPQTDGEPSKP